MAGAVGDDTQIRPQGARRGHRAHRRSRAGEPATQAGGCKATSAQAFSSMSARIATWGWRGAVRRQPTDRDNAVPVPSCPLCSHLTTHSSAGCCIASNCAMGRVGNATKRRAPCFFYWHLDPLPQAARAINAVQLVELMVAYEERISPPRACLQNTQCRRSCLRRGMKAEQVGRRPGTQLNSLRKVCSLRRHKSVELAHTLAHEKSWPMSGPWVCVPHVCPRSQNFVF